MYLVELKFVPSIAVVRFIIAFNGDGDFSTKHFSSYTFTTPLLDLKIEQKLPFHYSHHI